MRLLGLDHGSRTGWAAGDGSKLPAIGSRLNPHAGVDDDEAFFDAHQKWLLGLIRDFKPTICVYEAPIFPRGMTNSAALGKLTGLAAITGMTCFQQQVVVRSVSVQRVKQALTGKGNATKDEMVEAARAYGYQVKTPDEADAFGVWLAALQAYAPSLAARFEPLMFQGGAHAALD